MRRLTLYSAVAAALGTAAPVMAQDTGLEEIVVTATRRAQDLQQVPVSIVALTGNNLEMQGLDSLEDVGNFVPNINIQGGGGGTSQPQFRVRGLPQVGVYVDGVWQVGTAGFLTQDFVDIDRIEILRGPQGTTYGRDAVGGAIRIWTTLPGEEFGGQVTATTGTLNRRDVKASIDVPLTDNLLTKWTASSLYRDGYIQGLHVDDKFGRIDQDVYRGDVLWTPADNLSFRVTYQQDENFMTEPRIQDGIFDTAAQQGQSILAREFYALAGAEDYSPENMQAGFPGGEVGKWENRSNTTLPTRIKHEQTALDINWDVTDSISVQFLTAYTEQENDTVVDWDNSPYALVEDLNRGRLELFSEEIQFSGGSDRISWVAGLYYWDQKMVSRNARFALDEFRTLEGDPSPQLDINDALNSPTCQALEGMNNDCDDIADLVFTSYSYDQHNLAEQDGVAIFGETTIGLTETLDLTVGLRHHDQSNANGPLQAIPGVTASKPRTVNILHTGGDPFAGVQASPPTEVEFDEVTTKVALQKQFSDNFMGYVSYSEGFDSGGISIITAGTEQLRLPFDPQIIENKEIGLRSDLMDGLLRVNATLFHSDWLNIQNVGVVFDSQGNQLPQLATTNVGKAVAKGAELELTIVPTNSLQLGLNVGILDTEYTDIADGTFALDETTEFAQAPDLTYNMSLQHSADLSNGATFTSRLDYAYSDQFWRSLPFLRMDWYDAVPDGYDESGDWGVLNARFTYQPAGEDWSVAVFGTNLTNEYMLNSGFFHGIWGYNFATVGRPREAGVTLNFNF